MKKELPGSVITGALVVVCVVVAVLAWKFVLAPPSAPDAAHITKKMMEAHNSSAETIRADQMRRAAAANGSNH